MKIDHGLLKESHEFLAEAFTEHARACEKFPDSQFSMTALTEEDRELAKALLDEPWESVREEAVQVAVMALRVAVEGDISLAEFRKNKGLDYLNEPLPEQ